MEKYVVMQTAERLLKDIKLHVEDQLSQCVRLQIDIYCLLFCWKPPTARTLKWLLYLEVTWHLTIKLFPAKIIAKSMTTEGNSALLPAIREFKQKQRRRLRKRHLKRWIRSASNFSAPIPLSIRTIVVILFCSWILKDSFEVQDRKRKSLSSFTSSTKRKIYPMYY